MITEQVHPAAYVTIRLAAVITGMSEKAIRRKIEEGKWLEDREFLRADGGIFISVAGYSRWVERTASASRKPRQKAPELEEAAA